MGNRQWRQLLIGVLCIGLLGSTFASAQGVGTGYDRGYREGVQQGEQDGRQGREPQVDRYSRYRDADTGYQSRYGNRDVYRDEFRRGYSAGYRTGYDRYRINSYEQGRRDNRRDPRVLRGYQDPAFARGYSDGWDHGADDRRDRDRYDPVRHGDYRGGDDGYSRSYGSKDAYKNNYRAGFRQGYEEGYRNGTRYRR
jgi:flagellar biosynthesis/type III secretory pathway protein FliH